MALTVDDFDFPLPPELIAQHPAAERSGSRMLHVCGQRLADRQFADLPALLAAGDLLVFNDTRVIKARFFGHKESGGQVEVLLERIVDAHHTIAQVRASKSPKPGTRLRLADAFEVVVTGRAGASGEFFALEAVDRNSLWELAERYGKLPLPPYIAHPADGADETRYQTVYAREPGAVAAPTAGLHFDEPMLATLRARGINTAFLTLHVGAGTYQPVRVDKIAEHKMHSERFEIPVATAEAVAATRNAILKNFGEPYLPSVPRHYTTKAKNAQEAHECIRPTDMALGPEKIRVEDDQRKLYDLIWKRTIASQRR